MEDQNLANSVITVRATPLHCFNKADFPSKVRTYDNVRMQTGECTLLPEYEKEKWNNFPSLGSLGGKKSGCSCPLSVRCLTRYNCWYRRTQKSV